MPIAACPIYYKFPTTLTMPLHLMTPQPLLSWIIANFQFLTEEQRVNFPSHVLFTQRCEITGRLQVLQMAYPILDESR